MKKNRGHGVTRLSSQAPEIQENRFAEAPADDEFLEHEETCGSEFKSPCPHHVT